MLVFDFDTEMRLNDLKDNYQMVIELRVSLSEKRNKYRKFANIIKLDPNSLLTSCDIFERSLLLNCYTCSEQLVKNFIYEVIEKDRHRNIYLNLFINNKVNENTFSPRIKLNEIEQIISKSLIEGFKFPISKNNIKIKKYNEMIKARHKYAHSGLYDFDYQYFDNVIEVIEYLVFIFEKIITHNHEKWLRYQ